MGTQHEPIDYHSRPKPSRAKPRRAKPNRANSKAAGRRLVLEAQAQEDLLVAANDALAEMERMDGLTTDRRSQCRRGPYLGLRNALHALDALD